MFATDQERKELIEDNDFGLDYVVRFEKNSRQSELAADDSDHALHLYDHWIDNGANYVEIFRVLFDGSLNPTSCKYGEVTGDENDC